MIRHQDESLRQVHEFFTDTRKRTPSIEKWGKIDKEYYYSNNPIKISLHYNGRIGLATIACQGKRIRVRGRTA